MSVVSEEEAAYVSVEVIDIRVLAFLVLPDSPTNPRFLKRPTISGGTRLDVAATPSGCNPPQGHRLSLQGPRTRFRGAGHPRWRQDSPDTEGE